MHLILMINVVRLGLGWATTMAIGLPVIRKKESSLASLFYFLKHTQNGENSVIINSMTLEVLMFFTYSPKC